MRAVRRPLNTSFHRTLLALTAGLLTLSACGSDATTQAAPPAATSAAPVGATALTVQDPWVKTATAEMTAAFGTVTNTGSAPVTIVSAKTSASARTELHEVVDADGKMIMRPKPDGFTIPAGGQLELKPGGLHIMIMDLAAPVAAGDEVTFRLTLSDGTTKDFSALAKATTAGEENYESDAGMDMSAPTATATP